MAEKEILAKSLGIARYSLAAVAPSGQGFWAPDRPPRLERDRLQSELSMEVDPVLDWIAENFGQENGTSLGTMVLTSTRVAIVEEEGTDEARVTTVLDISDMIAGIRAALSLQIKEIAAVVGVERPTIYAWLQRKSTPFEQNRNRLNELFSAARRWQSFSPQPMGKWVRSTDSEGKSVLGLLSQAPLPERELDKLMRSLAEKVALEKPVKSTAKNVAEKHGIDLSQIPDQSGQVDTITGRRISEE